MMADMIKLYATRGVTWTECESQIVDVLVGRWNYAFVVPAHGRVIPYCGAPRRLKIITVSPYVNAMADITSETGLPDGKIDIFDYNYVAAKLGHPVWNDFLADINGDGNIDVLDLNLVKQYLGTTCPQYPFDVNLNILVYFSSSPHNYYATIVPSPTGLVEAPNVPFPLTIHVYSQTLGQYVNAFTLACLGTLLPTWKDQNFDHGLDTQDPEGVWHPMFEDNGIKEYEITWEPSLGAFTIRNKAEGKILPAQLSAVSILNGKLPGGYRAFDKPGTLADPGVPPPPAPLKSLKYPNSFGGALGPEFSFNPGEAIVYYDEIPPLYLNMDVELLSLGTTGIAPAARQVFSGLCLWGWIDQFNDYDAPIDYAKDQYMTIAPVWLGLCLIDGWNYYASVPHIGGGYHDAAYHYEEYLAPSIGIPFTGTRKQFSVNLSAILKKTFEYDWSNARNLCGTYSVPEPEVLKNRRIIDLTDHMHIYAIHIYVEAHYTDIKMRFYEASLSHKPKWGVVG
ncbi:MAG: dockerin type I repeat-containing protein [Candidatus Bathyarchaeia archaeon]